MQHEMVVKPYTSILSLLLHFIRTQCLLSLKMRMSDESEVSPDVRRLTGAGAFLPVLLAVLTMGIVALARSGPAAASATGPGDGADAPPGPTAPR